MDIKSTKDCLIVGQGVVITGGIKAAGTVQVEGTVDGTLEADELLVGPMGQINGTVTTRVAEVRGRITESLYASERVAVMSTGRVEGRLSYKSIAVEHGGVVEGTVVFLNETGGYNHSSGGSAD